MAFESIKKLTLIELLAIAQIKYGANRFTANELAKYLSALFSCPFKVGTNNDVVRFLGIAEIQGLVEEVPGPRGGTGFRVTHTGSESLREVEFPEALIERRQRIDDDKILIAKENAAPVVSNLFHSLPNEAIKERRYVSEIWRHWLTRGWLSTKQVHSIAEIALNFGIYIDRSLYIGAAADEWRTPYIEAERKKSAQQKLLVRQRLAALEQERRLRETAQAAIRAKNRQVATELKSSVFSEKLSGLTDFATWVFPETNLSKSALTAAYSGNGAKALRVCISALAFGLPPNKIWAASGSQSQPDENSDVWRTVIEHEAYRAHAQSGIEGGGVIDEAHRSHRLR